MVHRWSELLTHRGRDADETRRGGGQSRQAPSKYSPAPFDAAHGCSIPARRRVHHYQWYCSEKSVHSAPRVARTVLAMPLVEVCTRPLMEVSSRGVNYACAPSGCVTQPVKSVDGRSEGLRRNH